MDSRKSRKGESGPIALPSLACPADKNYCVMRREGTRRGDADSHLRTEMMCVHGVFSLPEREVQ